jgi:hypothetical protein
MKHMKLIAALIAALFARYPFGCCRRRSEAAEKPAKSSRRSKRNQDRLPAAPSYPGRPAYSGCSGYSGRPAKSFGQLQRASRDSSCLVVLGCSWFFLMIGWPFDCAVKNTYSAVRFLL